MSEVWNALTEVREHAFGRVASCLKNVQRAMTSIELTAVCITLRVRARDPTLRLVRLSILTVGTVPLPYSVRL